MRRNKVSMVTPAQLEATLGGGDTPVIDIRPPAEYKAGFIQGSINLPLYQPIEGWEQRKVLRRLGFALFGVWWVQVVVLLHNTPLHPQQASSMARKSIRTL